MGEALRLEGAAAEPEGGALLPQLRLLQMVSAAFPVGAFAYSHGLEAAVDRGWVAGETGLARWLAGVASQVLVRLDLPVLAEMRRAWLEGRADRALALGELVCSFRESAEFLSQEHRLGRTLAKALGNLEVSGADALLKAERPSYVVAFALGVAHFGISTRSSLAGYAYAFCEQQVNAATRLLPLGHSAGQRVLSQLLLDVPRWVDEAMHVALDEMGATTPGLAMASAWHETQYTRLFLS